MADAALVVEGMTIVWTGARADVPAEWYSGRAANRTFEIPYIMPGLWECVPSYACFPFPAKTRYWFISLPRPSTPVVTGL
ncbi:hypothetical protein GGR56DRAFT_633552 [Xylariaceae sp. FL0804]|nr:hypothetical protein GGR56DRAFT_633552 [Xylariaceae sp. FL0804]